MNPLPALIAQIDGVNIGDGIGAGVGGRVGTHTIAAFDGVVPVAEVFSYGSAGSEDGGPVRSITEEQAREYAVLFAAAPDLLAELEKAANDMAEISLWLSDPQPNLAAIAALIFRNRGTRKAALLSAEGRAE